MRERSRPPARAPVGADVRPLRKYRADVVVNSPVVQNARYERVARFTRPRRHDSLRRCVVQSQQAFPTACDLPPGLWRPREAGLPRPRWLVNQLVRSDGDSHDPIGPAQVRAMPSILAAQAHMLHHLPTAMNFRSGALAQS